MAISNNVQRKQWLDIAKGIGIFFVAWGHLFVGGGGIWCRIFAFHMPLFFFCSGVTFRPARNGYKDFLIKKIKGLMIPYFAVLLVGFAITMAIPSWRTGVTIDALKEVLRNSQPEVLHVGQIWFLLCLFIVVNMFFLLYKLIGDNNIAIWGLVILIIAFMILHLQCLPIEGRLPLKIDSALYGLEFYVMGFLFNRQSENKDRNVGIKGDILLFLLFLTAYRFYDNGIVNICDISYGNDFTNFLFYAVGGITFIVIVSKAIKAQSILEYIGKNSLFIFSLHSFAICAYEEALSFYHGYPVMHMNNMSNLEALIGGILIVAVMAVLCKIYSVCKTRAAGIFD